MVRRSGGISSALLFRPPTAHWHAPSTGSRYPFFHRCKTKRQRFRSQRGKEGKNKDKDQGGYKGKGTGKGKDYKVDLTSSPPFRLVLGRSSTSSSPFLKGSLGVVLSRDGIEGVPTRCFFVLFVLTRRQPLRVESV